ncbi:pilus assembly protein TadG-related protein [Bradyrhizobium sp.]|uniref:TadE/TadG family type IV pilus assembly protein n=1 Tax=Bradyrhizobium sp. TaxID=376 RepID=UPI003C758AE8
MHGTAIFNRVRTAAGRFGGARRGNVAVIFAIAAVPIISFVGAAVDYSRAAKARSSMQTALDSTALMLSKDLTDGIISAAQISTKAQTYFNALYTDTEAQSVSVNATYAQSNGSLGSTIQVSGSGSVNTQFMRVAGFPHLDFSTSSTSAWGYARMRVALVLDNTGSMADAGKMAALQPAAKTLIDQLSGLARNPGDVYVSIIPFAKDVNVGPSNYNQSWIDWTAWDAANGTCSRTRFTTQSSCLSNGRIWTPHNHNTWNGCVWDRDQNYDTLNTAPTLANASTLFPAEQWSACPVALMPLSYDWTALKNLVDTMTPNGNTNQAIGLAWGWQSLAQTAPLNAPAKDPNYTYRDAIVILSDGLNTQDRWYVDAASIDARQRILCDNAKAAQITIYTVQVNTGGDPTSAVLQYCASGPDKFFLITSASQTLSVFNSIGTSLSKLHVAR